MRIQTMRASGWVGLGLLVIVIGVEPVLGAGDAGGFADRLILRDAGLERTIQLETDEVMVNRRGQRETRRTAVPGVAGLRAAVAAVDGADVELVAYETGVRRNGFSRRLVTRRLLVECAAGTAADLAGDLGLVLVDVPVHAPGWAVLEARDALAAWEAVPVVRAHAAVRSADVLLARLRAKKLVPNDPLVASQWHHRNTTQGGGALWIDANPATVWDNYRGAGVVIGILDDGVQFTHPDLQPNYDTTLDYDFNGNDADPSPVDPGVDDHGTACAGVAAARGNNALGGCGVAYEATLAGFRLIAQPATDQQEADAFAHRNDVIQIKNNSWGAPDDGTTLEGPGTLAAAALANGTANGRGGLGTIFVFAGGNGLDLGDNSNYDGYANSIHTIAVGAVNDDGFQSYYSERGANLVVCAPSSGGDHHGGMVTTDLTGENGSNHSGVDDLDDRNYTREFGGTSSAAPLVSGVCALMLQANPKLGWRDVKEILMRSARQVHHTDPDWVVNGAGFHFNHKYGAGLVDAAAAVAMAKNWVNLGSMISAPPVQTTSIGSIPDNSTTGVSRTFFVSQTNLRVEHVTLTLTAPHASRGDLDVTLTSPAGTVSKLAEQHFDDTDGYQGWTFSSVRHWGESAYGSWTLVVRDLHPGETGSLGGCTLTVHGSAVAAARVVAASATLLAEGNLPANSKADPGENVSVSIGLKNIGAAAGGAVTATLLEAGGVTGAGAAQNYGTLAAGGGAASRTFSFTAGGCSGASTKLVLKLESTGVLLGYATWQLPLGVGRETASSAGGQVTINDYSLASPYPSTVTVAGITGRVQGVKAAINSFTHDWANDASVILKGPDGLHVTLFSDGPGFRVAGSSFVFDDNGGAFFPSGIVTPSGSYRPWDPYGIEIVGGPASEPGYGMIDFAGLQANGTWGLYAEDQEYGESGSIHSWNLTLTSVDCTDNIRVAAAAATASEAGGTVQVKVSRTGGREGGGTVGYTTVAGTATAGVDFTPVSGTLTFAAGEMIRTIAVPIVADGTIEGNETFQVVLSGVLGNATAGAELTTAVTIENVNLPPLEAWRVGHFGSTANSGDGADLNDFDHDGLVNLVEYGFGLDPKSNSAGQVPRPQRTGGEYVVEFDGLAGVSYGADWSATLEPGSWQPMTRTGSGNHYRFAVSTTGRPVVFVRLRVGNP
jgi:subtilisin-like proprotein convertase family protein